MMQRITLLVWAALAASVYPGFAAEQKIKVAYAAISPIMSGVWMAKETRAFERHGLDADLVYLSSGSITTQAMLGGDLDVAVAASNAVITAILKGAPLLAVGSVANRPAMRLWVQSEISKPEQLQGKIFGITRPGSTSDFLTKLVLEKYHLQNKAQLQPFGGTREIETAFRAGLISGAVISMKPGPDARLMAELGQLGIPFSQDLIEVKKSSYKSEPKTIEAFLRAYITGVAALNTDTQMARKVFAKYMRSQSVDEALELATKYLEKVPRVDPAVIQTVLNWEGQSQMPVADFYDNAMVDKLVKEGFVDRLYKK
ncbi:MAG TPA: ABC transporter substrate-binding protein [Candidatus Binatia bacterium]|jgi:NitT/TauT family transport system substrate-binding protein